MLNIHTKRHVRFVTVEQPTAWVVVAILLETTGTETVAIAEPRVVKIIPKLALRGSTMASGASFLLGAPHTHSTISRHAIRSPFVSLFGCTNARLIVGLAPMPPTTI